jgi:predicted RND superfamily exporter protein
MKTVDKSKNLTLSILLPVLIHGLYNYFLFVDFPLLSLLIVIFGVVYARKAIKLHQEQSPFKKI